MSIDRDTVKYAAHLSRIGLEPQELEKLAGQLKDILDFIDKLNKIDIKDIRPTSHILPINNVFRDDSPGESLPVEKVLMNAPQKAEGFFVVPRVIE